jgi:hypothetical protein
MKITIRHQLSFPVESGSARSVQHLLLTPLNGPTQTVGSWTIDMPGIESAARLTDAFGNRAHLVSQARPEAELVVTVTGTVETTDRNGVLGRPSGEPVIALYKRVTDLTTADPDILEPFKTADRSGAGRIALLHGLMGRIGELYSFGEEAEDEADVEMEASGAAQTQSQSQCVRGKSAMDEDTVRERKPADAATFAHGFIGAARALGIPARYVTGYLAADEDHQAAFHAWAEAYDDGLGWIGFDAALGICPTDRHVRLAVGLDARSTMPVRVAPELEPPKELEVSIEAVASAAQ